MAEIWVRRFEGIRDPAVRVRFAIHSLSRITLDSMVDLLTGVAGGAETGLPTYRELLDTLYSALSDPAMRERRRRAADLALEQGHVAIADALGSGDPIAPVELGERAVPDFRLGRPPTLGERKSLARDGRRAVLQRVIRDPHPQVIRIVLDNPKITEEDVLRMAARRPVAPEVLDEIYRHTKWSRRYRVRVAIAKNPHTPVATAVQIASQLRRQDAKRVAESPELAQAVRRAARHRCRGGVVH